MASANDLSVYLTGSAVAAAPNCDASTSLGGKRSSTKAGSLESNRVNEIPGIMIDFVAGDNGVGNGRLEVVGDNKIKWAAPGEDFGVAQSVAFGTTVVLPSNTASKYAVVTRTSAATLVGSETTQLMDIFNNGIGGSNFSNTEAAAGEEKYRGFNVFNNHASLSITAINVWLDPDMASTVRIASETVDANGDIQEIANETTEPSGRAWVNPTTEGTALSLGTLTTGTGIGLWIENSILADEVWNDRVDVILHFSFTIDGGGYDAQVRGIYRIANDGVEGYVLYNYYNEAIAPDPSIHTPKKTSETYPIGWTGNLAEGTFFWTVTKENRFGVESAILKIHTLEIDGAGDALEVRPQAPQVAELVPIGDGKARITALYLPDSEESVADVADTFVLWVNDDGKDPDETVDTPTATVAMLGGLRKQLTFTSDASLDGAPFSAKVGTRRGSIDSASVLAVSGTASTLGPARPDVRVTIGNIFAVYQAITGPTETVYTDEPNDIRVEVTPGRSLFYAGSVLIWAIHYDSGDEAGSKVYLNHAFDKGTLAISGAGSGTVETANWNGTKELYIVVNGVRRMLIDVTRLEILNDKVEWGGAYLMPQITPDAAIFPRFAEAVFSVWDQTTKNYVPCLTVNSDGVMNTRIGVDLTLVQAEIEAL